MPNTEIQKAQKILKSVQELDVLPICDIVNVSKKTQDNFLKAFNYKPSIQQTKEFFNKEKVKLKDEVEIETICKVLDIATLLEKLNLNIRDILKTAGISPNICDKLDKDYTIKSTR